MTTAIRRTAALLALLLAVTACAQLDVEIDQERGAPEEITDAGADGPTGDPTLEPPDEGEDLEVRLTIVEGDDGEILAFVPVEIHGSGPYSFALDTGASTSVVATDIATDLDLEVVGAARGVTGVTGSTDAEQVQIDDWRMGDVDLGARPVIALELAEGPDGGIDGLIGSDVLNQFGAVTIDYEAGVLRLRPSR